jgi:hypothetical protein
MHDLPCAKGIGEAGHGKVAGGRAKERGHGRWDAALDQLGGRKTGYRTGASPYCPEGDRFCGVAVWRMEPAQYRRLI